VPHFSGQARQYIEDEACVLVRFGGAVRYRHLADVLGSEPASVTT
jgi:hypothetical protein